MISFNIKTKKNLNKGVLVLCLIFLVIGIFYAVGTKPWNHPDEFGHFTYIKYIEKFQSIPAYTNKFDFWESHQPPLYYILNVPVTFIFSGQEIITQLIATRIFNLLFAVINIWIIFKIFKHFFRSNSKEEHQPYLILISTIMAGLWPMFVFISSGLSNDNLANLLGSLVILYLLKLPGLFKSEIDHKKARNKLILGSLLISSLLLTKTSLYFFAVVVLVTMIYWLWHYLKSNPNYTNRRFLIDLLITGGIIFVLSGWFFIRNLIVVGDLFGWFHFNRLYQFQESDVLTWSGFSTWLKTIIKSTLGIFGYFNIVIKYHIIYKIFYGLLGLSLIGNIYYFIRYRQRNNRNLLMMYFLLFLIFFGTFIYSLNAYQPQGRYLLPCLSSFIIFFAVGTYYHIKSKKILMGLLSLTILVFMAFSFVNLQTIIQSEKNTGHYDVIEDNLLNKKWKSEAAFFPGKVYLSSNIKDVPITVEGSNALLYCFGDIRQDTSLVDSLIIEIKTDNISKIKITPAYIANNYFDDQYSKIIELYTDGEYHQYKMNIEEISQSKPDVLFGLEIKILEGTDNEEWNMQIGELGLK
ncbi:MAG: hypothetical protein Q8P20_01760 [bacterium]|nr:hypothetical protein [bacterium]